MPFTSVPFNTFNTNVKIVFISLICIAFTAFAIFRWGIPYASYKIAQVLPTEISTKVSEETLELLDKYYFKSSKLNKIQKERIRESFEEDLLTLLNTNDQKKYKLHFRLLKVGKQSMANAFELPSGDIILTDRFVQLSSNQEEINSVLLHEIGHIEQKHSLQQLIAGSFVGTIVVLITGDASAFADMEVGLGAILVNSNYSRNHEIEADEFAFKKMLIAKIDPQNFSNIMRKMSIDYDELIENKKSGIFSCFSSHPDDAKRIDLANQYKKCFKMGVSTCKLE